jgi:predicted Rossmann-fold nucleotide-binding protein
MEGYDLPYQPIPQKLYTNGDLFEGFDPNQAASWVNTPDFLIYRHFVTQGRTTPANPYMGMMQSLHDNAISQATAEFIDGRRVVAVVGDHSLPRDSAAYWSAAVMSRRLTREGYLICTGGGPGAMEAGHLGAALAGSADTDLDRVLALLKTRPLVPNLAKIVDAGGEIDFNLVAQADAWFRPAFESSKSIHKPGESLAIPTWHYGHEPSTPFATHIAKYFQNSIREDGLLAIARQGIICIEGKAGTIQEIFQDSVHNYYQTFGQPTPMVLFGVEYWTNSFPVAAVLQKLFPAAFEEYVKVTDDVDEAVNFIMKFSPSGG